MTNPYTLRAVTGAKYFDKSRGGRGALSHRLLAELTGVKLPDALALLGEKRSGKTSLLNFLEDGLRDAGQPCVRLNLQELCPHTDEGFYQELGERMADAGFIAPNTPMGYRAFRAWLRERKREGRRLTVLLDEFDILARDHLRFPCEFFDNLRALGNDYPVVFVVATPLPLKELIAKALDGSPFFNIFTTEPLGLLSMAEAQALVNCPDGVGEFESEVLELGGRHPFFLQLACQSAWNKRAEGAAAIREAYYFKACDTYADLWERCEPGERAALCALANGTRAAVPAAALHTLTRRGLLADGPALAFGGFKTYLTDKCQTARAVPTPRTGGHLPCWVTDPSAPKLKCALVLGVDYVDAGRPGGSRMTPLRYAEKDAVQLAKHLAALGFTVKTLTGPRVTRAELDSQLTWFESLTRVDPHPESCFVFHFSGHGHLGPSGDETAYLMFDDSDPAQLPETAIEMRQLVTGYLPRVRVPHSLVLLDCCHAGAAVGVRDLAPVRVGHLAQQAFTGVRGRTVLAACAGSNVAREDEALGHGIFTHYVLRHWRDREGTAGRVTFGTLVDYVGESMKKHGPGVAAPVYNGLGEGETMLLRPAEGDPATHT